MKPMIATKFQVCPRNAYIQPKLDGVRCTAVKIGKTVKLKYKSGKALKMPHISKALAKIIPTGVTLDGELYIHGEDFDTISSLVRRHREESKQLEYHVYDAKFNAWPSTPFEDRTRYVQSINTDNGAIQNVTTWTADNDMPISWYDAKHRELVAEGYEGSIIRSGSSYYGQKSITTLQKRKDAEDTEFEIVGYKEGTGAHQGMVIWTCSTDEGHTFDVVPNGNQERRRQLYECAVCHIGDLLKVRHSGYTENGVPKCTFGLGIRDRKDML